MPASTVLQRSSGKAHIVFKHSDGQTRLDRLHQQGCAKLRLPKSHDFGVPEAVIINTAGGLTGGDRFEVEGRFAPHTHACITTQAAERIYRSTDGPATVSNRLEIEAGAFVEWLPQETIMFDGGRISRRFEVDLAHDAGMIAVESWQFGRTAMGETVRSGGLSDQWRIRREGRLIFADGLRLEGDIQRQLDRPAVGDGSRAMACLLVIHAEAGQLLCEIRERLNRDGVHAGASQLGEILVVRALANNTRHLRNVVGDVISFTRSTLHQLPFRLPRVWSC
jgi:urease accessory protein